MSAVKELYGWVLRRIPPGVRANLTSWGLKTLASRWDPRNDPEYRWPMPGMLEGHRMRFRRPEDFQFLQPEYEPAVCALVARLVRPGWYCVDAGAHIGFFTLLMAKLVGSRGHVIAFEAVPENAAVLRQNVEINAYTDRVTVENLALSDGHVKEVVLYRGPSSFEASVVIRGGATHVFGARSWAGSVPPAGPAH